MLYCHTIEGHDGCTDRCRNIRTRSDKAAVLQTATDSVAPMNSCLRARREPIGAVSLFFAMGKIRGTPRLRSHISAHRATTKSSEQVLCFQKKFAKKDFQEIPRLPWAQEASGSNPDVPTNWSFIFNEPKYKPLRAFYCAPSV
jgi:hypothetical protein